MDIYRMCGNNYEAAKQEITGIQSLRSFDQKFPAQLSDREDPVAEHSSIYANWMPSQATNDKMHAIRRDQNRTSDSFATYLQRKNFVNVTTDHRWRIASIRQQQLASTSDNNLMNSIMVERVSEEDIIEQASLVVGEYPYRPEVEEDIVNWLNVINKKGKLN